MTDYQSVAPLPLRVERIALHPRQLEAPSGWVRRTTRVELHGGGLVGAGEDVNWTGDEQLAFQARDPAALLASCGGPYTGTFDGFCRALDAGDLLAGIDDRTDARLYRRWAFESAALDLALRQSHTSLADALGRTPRPLHFVSSSALGTPPSLDTLHAWRTHLPGLRVKVDYAADWDDAFAAELAALEVVDVVDLKGLYRGSFEGPPPHAEGYARVLRAFPAAWIEDPAFTADTTPVLAPARERISWDVNLHSLADLVQLRDEPRAVNIKPSRFGFVRELFAVYAYCAARNITMYGGGQFELDVGRRQIQLLASLFHPDGPNDTAPDAYHDATPRPGLPAAPLPPGEFTLPAGF